MSARDTYNMSVATAANSKIQADIAAEAAVQITKNGNAYVQSLIANEQAKQAAIMQARVALQATGDRGPY